MHLAYVYTRTMYTYARTTDTCCVLQICLQDFVCTTTEKVLREHQENRWVGTANMA